MMITETVEIPLERYDELIKKEALFNKIMEGKEMNVYLYDVAASTPPRRYTEEVDTNV